MAKKKVSIKKEKREGSGEVDFGEPIYAQKVKKQKIKVRKSSEKEYPTLKLVSEFDIAMDFATKAYEKFNKLIKSVILFGSSAKKTAAPGSDVDIIILIDDSTIQWDQELIAWYREELGKLIQINPYQKSLHINSVKLTTWWIDLLRGDPVVINVIRWGQTLIDFGGFFSPLKILLQNGAIKSTPESIYTALQRAPAHMARSKAAVLGAIEGLYWACVDSSHAALISAKQLPPSPEHIPDMLKEVFVARRTLDMKYVLWYKELYNLAHKILRGELTHIEGKEIDLWESRTDEFVRIMAQLVKKAL
ncbi:nucleotidyltransferase domain-containing protein [Candidatus Pacearchaeota archaeon]|nr:nucleotidyltransferase domain-containing protein [Candidatus Pacearchaeota archaeon]